LSSILNALKKVEDQQIEPGDDHSLSKQLNPKKTIGKRARRPWLFNRILIFGIPLFILAVIGYFSYRVLTISESVSTQVAPAPEKDPVELKTIKKKPSKPDPVTEPQENSKNDELPPKPLSKSKTENQKPFRKIKKTKPISDQKPRTKTVKKIIPVDPDIFKLEAIIWSKNPESRFAVINEQIVKKGGMVDGYEVTEIEREYVAIGTGDEEIRLRFIEE